MLLSPSLNRRKNELIGLIWMAGAVLLLLSLVSFSTSDRSFHTSSVVGEVHNWAGTIGSHLSDLLLQGFGVCAYLIPLGFCLTGWRLFRSRNTVENWVQAAGA